MPRPMLTLALALAICTLAAPPPSRATPDPASSPRLERLPAGGFLFATQLYSSTQPPEHRFTIAEISASGLRTVLSEDHADYSDLLWTDFRTLIAVGSTGEDRQAFVQVYLDGKRHGERLVIPASTWDLRDLEPPYGYYLYANTKRELRVGACFRSVERGDYSSQCVDLRTVGVDPLSGSIGRLQRKLPKGFDGRDKVAIPVEKMKTLKAPAGYSIKLHKTDLSGAEPMMGDGRNHPAFTCTGPNGSATWPNRDTINWEFLTRPKSVRWVSHVPPIFVVNGPATDPIARTYKSHKVFVACSREPLEDVVFGPHGIWFEKVSELDGVVITGARWVVRVGPVELGAVPGDSLLVLAPE